MTRFAGFSIPEGAWLPPEIIFLIPHLKESELKCLIIALYHYTQVGGVDALSLSDFERLSGLTSSSVSTALQTLIGNHPLRNGQQVQLLERIEIGNSFAYEPIVKRLNGLNFRPGGANFEPGGLNFRPFADQLIVKESVNLTQSESKLTDSDSEVDRAEIVRELRALGVNPKPIGEILGKHPVAYVREKMGFYRFALTEQLANGPGWLVSACRYNWGPPLGYVAGFEPRSVPVSPVPLPDETPVESDEPGPDDELDAPSENEPLDEWDGVGMRPEAAWQVTLGQLQYEMPKATYETYVRQAKFGRYIRSEGGAVMQVCVANRFVRDWLTERLGSTVQRMLTGIRNETVQVVFISE